MEFLEQEHISPALLDGVRAYRAQYPAEPALQGRIPQPRYHYYGKEVWEAAIAALLCGTAFAAYTNGWFGFDRLFGEKTALIEGHIASYDETTDVDITQPTYTEEEQAMIDEGTMQVPDIADLSDTGVSAETDDFTFALESMLVSRNSLYAILRIDAKNDDAAAELAAIRRSSSECCGSVRITTQTSAASARIIGWNGKTAA